MPDTENLFFAVTSSIGGFFKGDVLCKCGGAFNCPGLNNLPSAAFIGVGTGAGAGAGSGLGAGAVLRWCCGADLEGTLLDVPCILLLRFRRKSSVGTGIPSNFASGKSLSSDDIHKVF